MPIPAGSPKHLCLLVTLHKGGMAQLIRDHVAREIAVHLFVRADKKRGAMSTPFVYCGPVTFVDWEGDSPITVRWKLEPPLHDRLFQELTSPNVG